MSLSVKQLYEFGEFRLDIREKILMRGDQPVELTPKVFELLSIMVENPGRLLGKDELMDKIWADSFVEESNLTFNIRQLRKILGDDAHDPKYIKTVRMHGYRFIADVKWISQEDKPKEEYIPVVEDKPIEEIEPKEIVAPIVSQPSESTPVQQPAALPKTKNYLVPIFVASHSARRSSGHRLVVCAKQKFRLERTGFVRAVCFRKTFDQRESRSRRAFAGRQKCGLYQRERY